MSKIGIINCYNESKECSSFGCFKAFNDRAASFKNYDESSEIISFVHCNGCSETSVNQVLDRAKSMKKRGVDSIHLATCIKLNCPFYNKFIDELSKKLDVKGYTHDVQ